MRFLIDGYNLLHAMGLLRPNLGPEGLLKARTALLGRLAGALGSQAGEVTVIFDAANAPADVPREFEHRGLHVRFAERKQSADDLIEELIRSSSAPRQLTVVSDDHRLVNAAQRRGCRPLRCDAFLTWLAKRYRRTTPRPAEPKEKTAGLGETQTERWLKEFGTVGDDPELEELFPFQGETDENSR